MMAFFAARPLSLVLLLLGYALAASVPTSSTPVSSLGSQNVTVSFYTDARCGTKVASFPVQSLKPVGPNGPYPGPLTWPTTFGADGLICTALQGQIVTSVVVTPNEIVCAGIVANDNPDQNYGVLLMAPAARHNDLLPAAPACQDYLSYYGGMQIVLPKVGNCGTFFYPSLGGLGCRLVGKSFPIGGFGANVTSVRVDPL